MIDFHKFFANPFEDPEISFSEILTYTVTHHAYMVANDPNGDLAQNVQDTAVAMAALENSVSDGLTKNALQKARTEGKRAYREALPEKIERIHAAVVLAFGSSGEQYLECFPVGRTIFTTCKDGDLNNHLVQLHGAIVTHQVQVGATALALVGSLLSVWITIFQATKDAGGAKKSVAGAKDTGRNALRVVLFQNLLDIARLFLAQPEKCDMYCPQHLLRNPKTVALLPDQATLGLVSVDVANKKVNLTMTSDRAKEFELQRKAAGAVNFETVAETVAAPDGTATYQDTVPTTGEYEYQVVPKNPAGEGATSAPPLEVTV